MTERTFTIDDLVERTGFSRRTIRYYVQEGLLEPPAGRGRGGFYYDSHLERLGQIRELQSQGLRLRTIRERLAGSPPEPAPPVSREVWARHAVAPGLEIHVRRDVEERLGRAVQELVRLARSIAEGADEQ
jgi:DNA-binding transcriptional MerR regulator